MISFSPGVKTGPDFPVPRVVSVIRQNEINYITYLPKLTNFSNRKYSDYAKAITEKL